MIVEIVWPDCTFLGGEWYRDRAIDSFWVECSPAEGQQIVETYFQSGDPRIFPPETAVHRPDEKLWQFFLVSRDLAYVYSSWRGYPFSSQWYRCPFRQLPEPIEISCLEELREIEIPANYRNPNQWRG